MLIDRSKFLALASMLAAGGVACDREPFGHSPAPAAAVAPAPSVAQPAGPVSVDIVDAAASAAPACDDTQGVPEQCPSVGPSDEGICPDNIQKRCNDFKTSMKPRVAAQAVACLRALKGAERCDPARVALCGHQALMNACAEPKKPRQGEYHAAAMGTPASVTLAVESEKDLSPVATSCANITKSCGDRPLAPTSTDCRQTLTGMSEIGRANTVECVTQHCTDRGLLGCEAAPKVVSASLN